MSGFEVKVVEPGLGEQMLTPYVSNLSFRSIDPGGFGSVTFDLARDVDAADFAAGSEVAVYDAETGEQVGGGRILNPGRSVSERGGVWQVAALGEGPAHLQERTVPYHLIDTRLDAWKAGFTSNSRYSWSQGNEPGATNNPGWTFTISPGNLNIGHKGHLNYRDMEGFAGVEGDHRIEVGGLTVWDTAGNGTDLNRYRVHIATNGNTNATEIIDEGFFTGERVRRRQVATHWPAGGISGSLPVVRVFIEYERTGTSVAVGGDDDWMHVWGLRISALRLDRNGVPITTAGTYLDEFVLAHDAITDCWARFCPRLDLANARIDETATYEHQDLVWPDGITPYGVMEKLMAHDPAFTWAVWEKKSSGLYRAEWRERDLNVRYELLSDDGFSQTSLDTSPATDVYVVTEETGGRYWVVHVADDTLGGTGTANTVKMEPPDQNATDKATRFGEEELESSQLASAAAQVTVARKVYDHYTGRWVKPYMILPGYLCRVTGVRPNAGQQDASAIYRVTSNDYSADSGSSRLELNTYTLTEARAIADLANA